MSKQIAVKPRNQKSVSELPRLSISVYPANSSSIYQTQLLCDSIESVLAKFFQGKAIRVIPYQPPGMGAGGGDFVGWLLNFYHNHQLLVKMLTQLPVVIRVTRYIVLKVTGWYYKRLIPNNDYLPVIDVGFHLVVHGSTDDYTNLETLKCTITEFYNLFPEAEGALKKKHGELDFRYSITAKAYGTGCAISIANFHNETKVMYRILKKIHKLSPKPKRMTYRFVIQRHRFLRFARYKMSTDAIIF